MSINESKLERLTDYLDSVGQWVEEYVFENSDFADSYYCLVTEDQINFRESVREWVHDNYEQFDDSFADKVWERIDPGFDAETETDRNEYAEYSRDGCCIGSFAIDEYEEQLDFSDNSILTELHESGDLDDYLDCYRGDVYPCRSKRRERRESDGRYENVGRETYNPYNHKNPTLEVIVGVGGQVRFVIPAERMRELVTETVLQIAREG